MSISEQRQAGMKKFAEVMTFEPPPPGDNAFLQVTYDHLFAELWSRPGLGTRDRRLITLTVLVALGNELALTLHLGAAMKSGELSDEELDELIVHAAHYAGWPGAAIASQVLARLRAKRDEEG